MSRRTSKIQLSEEEAWKLYLLLEELNSFLHQPRNFSSGEEVRRWLESGVYKRLREAYYNIAGAWFEVDEETGCIIGPDGKLHGSSGAE